MLCTKPFLNINYVLCLLTYLVRHGFIFIPKNVFTKLLMNGVLFFGIVRNIFGLENMLCVLFVSTMTLIEVVITLTVLNYLCVIIEMHTYLSIWKHVCYAILIAIVNPFLNPNFGPIYINYFTFCLWFDRDCRISIILQVLIARGTS